MCRMPSCEAFTAEHFALGTSSLAALSYSRRPRYASEEKSSLISTVSEELFEDLAVSPLTISMSSS